MLELNLTDSDKQKIHATTKTVIEQQNKRTKNCRIIQTLLMISGIALICLGGFGVFGAGIFAGLAIGLGSFFVAGVFANIFVGISGYGTAVVNLCSNTLETFNATNMVANEVMERNFYLSIAIALIGIALITCGAFGFIGLGMACSIGIPIFFAALVGIIQNKKTLKNKILFSMGRLGGFVYKNFLSKRDENVMLLGSIVTCLTLGIMTLLGSLNLMFAIGLMIPLLVGSGIFKIVVFFKLRHEQKLLNEQMDNIIFGNITDQAQEQSLNLNNNKDNQKNNQFPPQDNANKENKGTDLNNPQGTMPVGNK